MSSADLDMIWGGLPEVAVVSAKVASTTAPPPEKEISEVATLKYQVLLLEEELEQRTNIAILAAVGVVVLMLWHIENSSK